MKKTFKIILRIILFVVLAASFAGLAWYEYNSISQKERDRQYAAYDVAKNEIQLNLNLVKVAVLTKDAELYHKSTENIDSQLHTIDDYPIPRLEQAITLQKIQAYNELLKSHENALREMISLDAEIKNISDTINENFSSVDSISRDSLKGASEKIDGLKIAADKYREETILTIVDKVNQILITMEESAHKLSDCIDSCYQENIKSISDELSNSLGKMVEGFPEQNQAFIEEFALDQLKELMEK